MRLVERRGRLVACILIFATSALAGPYEEGLTAYDQKRFDAAFALWLPLAEQGNAAAQFNVAALLEKGLGVPQDFAGAARWYLKAAEQGDVEAQYNVAVLYEKGMGFLPDAQRARYWYEKVVASPRRDPGLAEMQQRAKDRLASLSPGASPHTESVIAYDEGRFVLRQIPTRDCVLALQGNVTEDASFKFGDVVKKASEIACNRPIMLLLESPGGELFNSISLAYQVEAQAFRTVVRYDCASGCALVFLAGAERVLWGSRAQIGLHQGARVQEREGGETVTRCDASIDSVSAVKMRRYLYRRFANAADADRISRIIMETSCESIEWIHGQRAIDLRVATRLESEHIDIFGPDDKK